MTGLKKLPSREGEDHPVWGEARPAQRLVDKNRFLKFLFGVPPVEERRRILERHKVFSWANPKAQDSPVSYILCVMSIQCFAVMQGAALYLLHSFSESNIDRHLLKAAVFSTYGPYFFWIALFFVFYNYIRIKLNINVSEFMAFLPAKDPENKAYFRTRGKLFVLHIYLMLPSALCVLLLPHYAAAYFFKYYFDGEDNTVIFLLTVFIAFVEAGVAAMLLYHVLIVEKHVRFNQAFWRDARDEE